MLYMFSVYAHSRALVLAKCRAHTHATGVHFAYGCILESTITGAARQIYFGILIRFLITRTWQISIPASCRFCRAVCVGCMPIRVSSYAHSHMRRALFEYSTIRFVRRLRFFFVVEPIKNFIGIYEPYNIYLYNVWKAGTYEMR